MTTAVTAKNETLRTFEEHMVYVRSRGFHWVDVSDVTVGQGVALIALNALEEKLAATSLYGESLAELHEARDILAGAICRAVEAT
jgi:hypothetical protein